MIRGKKIITVLPAFQAGKMLEKTFREIPRDVVDEIILVDDASTDNTVEEAYRLGIQSIIQHERNIGYGGNQKTCYREALRRGADVVVMLHPDYQYTPTLVTPLAWLVAHETYDVVLGSRVLGNSTLSGGMPVYKYLANRILTLFENIVLCQQLSEYHTGYRAFSRRALETIPFANNSDSFLFDNQILAQIFYAGFPVGEVSCPTKYFAEATSMNLRKSIPYGFGVLRTVFEYRLQSWHLGHFKIFDGIEKGAQRSSTRNRNAQPPPRRQKINLEVEAETVASGSR